MLGRGGSQEAGESAGPSQLRRVVPTGRGGAEAHQCVVVQSGTSHRASPIDFIEEIAFCI